MAAIKSLRAGKTISVTTLTSGGRYHHYSIKPIVALIDNHQKMPQSRKYYPKDSL